MSELTMEPGFVTGEPRPEWNWTNDLALPTTMHLEPSFKEELGLVFLKLSRGTDELGIWLPHEQVESLRKALTVIADHATDQGGDEE
jgi:hypothetical protein